MNTNVHRNSAHLQLDSNLRRNTRRSSPAYFLGRSAGTWHTALTRQPVELPPRR
jgi:hypothetical protein